MGVKINVYKTVYHKGLVLSPSLFNAYTADINTSSRKFMYVDEVGIVAQEESFEKLADILNNEIIEVQIYFKSWFLTLNPNKITSIVFHQKN